MKNAIRMAAAGLAAALAAGCAVSVPEVRYYTFDMRPSGGAAGEHRIEIEGIRATEALTRGNILIRMSPTRAEYYANDQWLAGIEEQVTEKLEAELGPPKVDRPAVGLTGLLEACEQVDLPDGAEGHFKLDVTFTRDGARGAPLMRRVYDVRERACASDPDAVVAALSRALERVAASIAADSARVPHTPK